VWQHVAEDVRLLLDAWQDAFLSEFDRNHPTPLADRAAAILRTRYADALTIDTLARELGCARTRVIREFRATFEMSVGAYHKRVRLQSGILLLRRTAYSVEAIARIVGYRSPKHFYSALVAITGMTPAQVRAMQDSGPTVSSRL